MTPSDPLVRLLRHDWDPASWSEPPPADDIDWTVVVQAALDHGVGGLLCRSLLDLPAEFVPRDIAAAAVAYLEDSESRGSSLVSQLIEVLDTLAADGIPALPFKGPALAMLAHSSATIRPSRDIDVLVRKQDMHRSFVALQRLGYRLSDNLSPRAMAACHESYGQDIVFAEGRVPVEPHCAFVPSALAVDLDMEGWWKRSGSLSLAGRDIGVLSREDMLLTACLHGSKEKWWRLLWVADVAALIHRHPSLDWHALLDRANAAGARRMFLLGIALARDLFGSKVPQAVSAAIDADAICLDLVRQSKGHLAQSGTHVSAAHMVSRYHLRLRERTTDRVRYVWRTLTTPRFTHYGMIKLPDRLFAGYVVVKLVHDYVLLPLWVLGKARWWRRTST